MNSARAEHGFTLIEVLVALAILSVSLAVLLNVFSDGLSRIRANETRTVAGSLAQSLLAELGVSRPLRAGDEADSLADGYHWRIHAEPFGDAVDRKAWPAALLQVTVSVWKEGARPMELTMLRLAPKETRE